MRILQMSHEMIFIVVENTIWKQAYVTFQIGEDYILNVDNSEEYVLARCVWKGAHQHKDDPVLYPAYRFERLED